mmetsp:Transcript_8767/g.27265  ORF Transcript_8767/g.27265 Transcript_8767/m.27265 type:complete len:248 (-) Transcript_8767:115-858(-)
MVAKTSGSDPAGGTTTTHAHVTRLAAREGFCFWKSSAARTSCRRSSCVRPRFHPSPSSRSGIRSFVLCRYVGCPDAPRDAAASASSERCMARASLCLPAPMAPAMTCTSTRIADASGAASFSGFGGGQCSACAASMSCGAATARLRRASRSLRRASLSGSSSSSFVGESPAVRPAKRPARVSGADGNGSRSSPSGAAESTPSWPPALGGTSHASTCWRPRGSTYGSTVVVCLSGRAASAVPAARHLG